MAGRGLSRFYLSCFCYKHELSGRQSVIGKIVGWDSHQDHRCRLGVGMLLLGSIMKYIDFCENFVRSTR